VFAGGEKGVPDREIKARKAQGRGRRRAATGERELMNLIFLRPEYKRKIN